MKNIVVITLIVLGGIGLKAQNTSWFVTGQPYLKVHTQQAGIYKIPGTLIDQSGIFGLRMSQLQMFRRGRQVSIKVNDANQNDVFDNEDFVLFYGVKNDGALDKELYVDPSYQMNAAINLHSDSAAYFLTSSGQGPWLRVNTNSFGDTLKKISHHTQRIWRDYNEFYLRGKKNLSDEQAYASLYGESVGFGTYPFVTKVEGLKLNNYAAQANESIRVATKFVSHDTPNALYVDHFYGNKFQNITNLQSSSVITNVVPILQEYDLPSTVPPNSNDSLYFKYKLNNSPTSENFSLAYLHVDYPQQLVWDASKNVKIFRVRGAVGSGYFMDIAMSTAPNVVWNVTDASNIQELAFKAGATETRVSLNIMTGAEEILVSNAAPIEVKNFRVVTFSPLIPKAKLFLIITHEYLQNKSKLYENPVRAYAEYRASVAGGQYDTMVVNTEVLYNYFSFGDYTPMALRRFMEFMSQEPNKVPKALLLIGKGYSKFDANGVVDPYKYSYVPTWGDPGTDIPFTMGLNGAKRYVHGIPTGRLSVKTPQQVENYLQKIKEHESLSDNTSWKKNIVHLTGGENNTQAIYFKGIAAGWEEIAKKPYMAALVKSYSKSQDQFVQIFDLSTQLDEGASLVSILGHSSQYLNDVRIGAVNDPSFNYKNKGKYPIILLNGCESGNIYGEINGSTLPIFSETWINEPDKGSVGFYAHSNFGLVEIFRTFNSQLYTNWFSDSLNISKSFGEMAQLTCNQFVDNTMDYRDHEVRHVQQMTYMGDPMVKIFKESFVDFSIESQDVQLISLDNRPITALSDSFLLKFVVKNLGIVPKNQKINITVNRILPNGTSVLVKNVLTNFVSSVDTFEVYVPLGDINSAGENKIVISIDPNNFFVEKDKNNNKVEIVRFLPISDMTCLFPKEFSIQNKKVLNLVAQSTDLLREEQEYLIEVDTSFGFNSSAYQSKIIKATSLPTWEDINLFQNIPGNQDSVEFFWRVKFNVQGATDELYVNSSFIYINNGKTGWNQSKFHQFDKDELSKNLKRNVPNKSFEFVDYSLRLYVTAGEMTQQFIDSNQFYINNKPIYSSSFLPTLDGWNFTAGYIVTVYDKNSLRVYKPNVTNFKNPIWYYGAGYSNETALSRFLFGRPDKANDSVSHARVIEDLITYIEGVPKGDYIFINPMGGTNISTYSKTFKANFQKLADLIGTTELNNLQSRFMYGVLFRKGYGIVKEKFMDAPNTSDKFVFDYTLNLFVPNGVITSTTIGPSTSWGKLYLNVDADNANDTYGVDVVGVDAAGNESILFAKVTQSELDISSIDARSFANIRLKAYMSDSGLFTPIVIDRWMVTYGDEIPEGTLVLDKNKVSYKTIFKEEGDSLVSEVDFKNISDYTFQNPLIIKYAIKNASGLQSIVYDTIHKALNTNETISLRHKFISKGYAGDNTIEIFVNPKVQPELLYSNNQWTSTFKVRKDLVNPILDVTFDGRKILNGEIVSPTPFIQIMIKDENKFFLKTDTVGVKILMKKSCQTCSYTQVSLLDNNVKYYPATTSDNTFRIDFSPERLDDDIYTLCLQGADANNNLSGISPYCVTFQVINKAMMSNVYPYPNPFSNYTRFVFTLTGDDIPDEMKIQIMTVSGKVVREIIQTEIGPLRIGTNVTEYAWDGTDEYGDKLANGVYLYKVIARHSGAKYEKMLTAGDKAFKEDWGKLVILR